MSLLGQQGFPRGRNLQLLNWQDADPDTLATTVNTALKAMPAETRLLELVFRSDGTTFYAYAIVAGDSA